MKIFVSYSRRDAGDFANQIQRHLSAFDYEIFTDINGIRGGDVWSETIEENISNCDIFVVIVTHGALKSPHVEKEVLQAQKEKKTIIPCFHTSITPRYIDKYELTKFQGVEFDEKYDLARRLYLIIDPIKKPSGDKNDPKIGSEYSSHSSQWYIDKAKDFEDLGQYDRALKHYEKAIEKEPYNFIVIYNKALLLEKIGKLDESLEAIEQAIDIEPKNTDIWYHKASILEKLQKYEDALEAVDIDLKLDSKDVKSWTKKANILKKLERYDEGLKALDEIIGLDLYNVEALKNKGYILKKLFKYTEASQWYNKALEIDSKDLESLKAKGYSLSKLFKHNEAIDCYNKALEIEPTDLEAHKSKERIYEELERYNSKKVFISFALEDIEAAERIYRELKAVGWNTWLDKESLRNEGNLKEAIRTSRYFIHLISRKSIKNRHIKNELDEAFQIQEELEESEIYIIPLRLEECQIADSRVARIHDIDLFPDWSQGFQKVLLTMGIKTESDQLSEEEWNYLLNSIDQKKLIPFIGEYFTKFLNGINDKTFLTNQEIAEMWAEQYNYLSAGPYKLSEVAQFLAINQNNELYPKQTMARMLKNIQIPNFSSGKLSKSPYSNIVQLPLPIYLTTNYDFLIEEALKSQGKQPISGICQWNDDLLSDRKNGVFPSIFDKNFKPTEDKPLVYHLYGSIEWPPSMVMTEEDYQKFIFNLKREYEKKILPALIRTKLSLSTFIFIGYNIDDDNFHSLLKAFSFLANTTLYKINILVLPRFSDPWSDKQIKQRVLQSLSRYTNNTFRFIVYLGDLNKFLIELNHRWETFKNKNSITNV